MNEELKKIQAELRRRSLPERQEIRRIVKSELTPEELQKDWDLLTANTRAKRTSKFGLYIGLVVVLIQEFIAKWRPSPRGAIALFSVAACLVAVFIIINTYWPASIKHYAKIENPSIQRGAGADNMPSELHLTKGGNFRLSAANKRTQLSGQIEVVGEPEKETDYRLLMRGADDKGVGAVFRGMVRVGETNVVFNGWLEVTGFVTNSVTNLVYGVKP